MAATVGLTGGTGHIGGLLLRRLLEDPAVGVIRSVARRALPAWAAAAAGTGEATRTAANPPVRLVHTCADLRSEEARKSLSGCDVLYHLAAQVWRGPGREGPARMAAANVEGTRNVVRGAAAVVMASSASVYGAWADNPLPMDELHPPRPNPECPYAVQKLEAEQVCAEESASFAILRLSAVLGPNADARVTRAVHGYRLLVPAVRGAGQAVQWMDEADAVEGLLLAGRAVAGNGPARGEIMNLAPADWLCAGDVARLARSRVVALPRGALLRLSELGRYAGLSPFGADRAVLVSGPLAISPGKAKALLGWSASRTSEEVMREALSREWRNGPENRSP